MKFWNKFLVGVGWLSGGIVLLVLITLIAYEFNFRKTIIPKTYVSGIEMSRLTVEEAIGRMNKEIEEQGLEIILVDTKGGKRKLEIEDLEIEYQVKETVMSAWVLGRKGNILDRYWEKIMVLDKGRDLLLRASFDREALEGMIASVSAEVNIEPVRASLKAEKGQGKEKQVVFEQGEDGLELDEGKLEQLIKNNLSSIGKVEILMPIRQVKGRVSEEEREEMIRIGEKLVDRELRLTLPAESYSRKIKGETLVSWVDFSQREAGGRWQTEEIEKVISQVGKEIDRPAQDARFEFKNERLVDFIPDRDGLAVKKERLLAMTIGGLETEQEEVEIPVEKTLAKIRAGEINDLGIEELIGRGKSRYAHSIAERIHNVALAAARINGVLVPPGEVFSLNRTLGDISVATGYKSAYIIKDGRTVLGDGGGVCQVSTTLFRAILNAGLPVIERQAHAYRVSYYEQDSKPGFDATVFDPTADLRFKNDTGKHLLIQAKADSAKRRLVIDIYGTGDGRVAMISTPRIFSQTPPPEDLYVDDPTLPAGTIKQIDWKAWGAKVAFDYRVERGEEGLFKKTFYSNYRPWQAVYLRGTGG